MKNTKQKNIVFVFSIFIILISAGYAQQKEASDLLSLSLEDLLKIKVDVGSRMQSRTLFNSMTPVDIITEKEIAESGLYTLGEILQYYVPEFNYPHPTVADGTDHIWPGTLIGLNPDHVLVLINGKRWHHSALLHVNGTIGRGSTSPDYNAIPLYAIERIEILKDGASAQYGSDAIAGIINIILKKDFQTGVISGYSESAQKDGEYRYLSQNASLLSGKHLSVGLVSEYRDKGNINRAQPDPRPFYFDGDPRNDDPAIKNQITHRYGDAKSRDFNMLININGETESGENYYVTGKMTFRKGESAGFYRLPRDDRNVRSIYPDGFLPLIIPDISDIYLQTGIKRESDNSRLDGCIALGQNLFSFNVKNSLNASMGTNSPTEFFCGTLGFRQISANLDWNIYDQSGKKNLALGSEFRYEQFWIQSGEEASYIDGGVPILDGPHAGAKAPIGAQVFPGFQPENEVNANRWSISFYSEYLHTLSNRLKYSASIRFENYSDFGNSLNGKLQFRYQILKSLAFRTSAGTGFRAPSLQQSYYNSTATGWVENQLWDVRLLRVNHPLAKKLGSSPLKPEKAKRINIGLVYQPTDNFYTEINAFGMDLKDRIILTGEFVDDSTLFGSEIPAILREFNVSGARFFTNSVNTFTKGFNARVQYSFHMNQGTHIQLAFKHQWNKTEINGDIKTPEILKNYGTTILDADERNRITEAQPHHISHVNIKAITNNWMATIRFIRFGEFNSNQISGDGFQKMDGKILTYIRIKRRISQQIHLYFGINNLFDVYPEKKAGNNLLSVIFPYSLNSPFGFTGRSYFLQGTYRF